MVQIQIQSINTYKHVYNNNNISCVGSLHVQHAWPKGVHPFIMWDLPKIDTAQLSTSCPEHCQSVCTCTVSCQLEDALQLATC